MKKQGKHRQSTSSASNTLLLKIVIVLAILGFFISLYLVKNHYEGVSTGSFCDFGEAISCSLVNSSVFSEILHVPVALLGALWCVILALLALAAMKDKVHYTGIFAWAILGFLFVLYMIAAEIILRAVCPLCTAVHIITIIVLIISLRLYRHAPKLPSKKLWKLYQPWLVGTVILYLIPFIAFNIGIGGKKQVDYAEFAKCLDTSDMKMYGSFRCGVCARTREMFGSAFEFIEEIECHPQGKNAQVERCLAMNIERTPTWVVEKDGKETARSVGFTPAEKLAEMSGCSISLITTRQ